MKTRKPLPLFLSVVMILVACLSVASSANVPYSGGQSEVLSQADVPLPLEYDTLAERGHIRRLRSEEHDLDTAVFLNEDNTRTLYMFSEPIKYADQSGNIRDKTAAFSDCRGGYEVTGNEYSLFVGNDPAQGGRFAYNGHSLSLAPSSASKSIGYAERDGEYIVYRASDMSFELRLRPLLNGVEYTVTTNDANTDCKLLLRTDEAFSVSERADGTATLDFGEDAAFKLGRGYMRGQNGNVYETDALQRSLSAGGISLSVDSRKASAADIRTLSGGTLSASGTILINHHSAIKDAVVYSGKPSSCFGAYYYNSIGYLNSEYGVGELHVSFPGIASNTTLMSLNPNDVLSAKFRIYTASGGLTANIRSELYYGAVNESTLKYSDVDKEKLTQMRLEMSVAPLNGGEPMDVNMNGFVRACIRNDPVKAGEFRIILSNESNTNAPKCRDFTSTEYGSVYNNLIPHIIVDYGDAVKNIKLNVYYDDAYITRSKARYPNGGPTTRSNYLLAELKNTFLTRFNINVTTTYIHNEYLFYTDNCTNRLRIDFECNCYTDCDRHHTNTTNLLVNSASGNTATHFNMYMTGHRTCGTLLGVCNPGTAKCWIYGANTYSGNLCGVLSEQNIANIVFHEFGHFYGPDNDHYHTIYDRDPNDRIHDDECIWGAKRRDLTQNKICEACLISIENNMNNYNHQ